VLFRSEEKEEKEEKKATKVKEEKVKATDYSGDKSVLGSGDIARVAPRYRSNNAVHTEDAQHTFSGLENGLGKLSHTIQSIMQEIASAKVLLGTAAPMPPLEKNESHRSGYAVVKKEPIHKKGDPPSSPNHYSDSSHEVKPESTYNVKREVLTDAQELEKAMRKLRDDVIRTHKYIPIDGISVSLKEEKEHEAKVWANWKKRCGYV
jgi:hypothetical protein